MKENDDTTAQRDMAASMISSSEQQRVRAFLLTRWRERAHELGRPSPNDLSGACRFAAVFARAIYGGELAGNWYHVYCLSADSECIDLTDGVEFKNGIPLDLEQRARALGFHVDNIYAHDPRVWQEPEFLAANASVEEQVQAWVRLYHAPRLQPLQPLSTPRPRKRVRAYTRNMSPLHIRPLEAHEASNLRTLRLRALELAEEAFGSTLEAATLHPPTFWEHWTQASADGSVQRTFICEDENGKWLGMALVRTESASEAVLNAMWVEPEIRGRGVATALCDACSDWARAHGHERLVLVVLSDNEKARRAYEKAGFAVTDSFTAVDDNGRALNKLLCSRPLVAAENRSLAASSRQ